MSKKKIASISLSKLSNGTHYAFHSEVLERVKNDAVVREKVANELKAYEKAFKEEDKLFWLSKKSALTQEIQDADTTRDEAYGVFRNVVKALTKHPDEPTQKAAKKMWQVLKDYNINIHSPFYRQTGPMTKLIRELENEYKDDVATLNLTASVQIMREANDTLRVFMAKRNDERGSKTTGATKAVRKLVDDAYKELAEQLNALARIENSPIYDPCIDGWNGTIKYQRKQWPTADDKAEKTGDTTNTTGGNVGEIPDPVAPTPGGEATAGDGGKTGGDGKTGGGNTGQTPGGSEEELPDPLA
ncbi:MAG: DUF6261 family protein [Mediterranea sp.]|jgi:hypothetical protein|nr:DUF6261 family protein [Mediterranea sp.]